MNVKFHSYECDVPPDQFFNLLMSINAIKMVWNVHDVHINYEPLVSAHTEYRRYRLLESYCGVSEVPAGSRNGPCWSLVQPGCPPSSTVLSGPDTVPEENICKWLVTIQMLLQSQYQSFFTDYLWHSKVTDVLKVWADHWQFTLHSLVLTPHPLHFLNTKHHRSPLKPP